MSSTAEQTPREIAVRLWQEVPEACRMQYLDTRDVIGKDTLELCSTMLALIGVSVTRVLNPTDDFSMEDAINDIACSPCDDCPFNPDNRP